MHLPVSTPKKGRSCWYFAVYGPMAFSVDWTEAGVLGAGALGADGWESFTFVISRCMSKDVWSALIVPDPWMCILSKPSDAVDGHNINNSIKVWVLQIQWIGGVKWPNNAASYNLAFTPFNLNGSPVHRREPYWHFVMIPRRERGDTSWYGLYRYVQPPKAKHSGPD